ncbi:MAG: sigma-70 family RNA polymerase sigma factor [Candidatus Poribacteria bacterium]|nr:sigma-70 family RNA polymerase sigma factor [Candidatus Poribacteria bacterium]
MERDDDVQLIREILSGDDEAFNALVQKYEKSVHALVWRKIGDFHYAEEITQDAFLQAYEKLSTLKDPSQFAGWLYVIANRLCIAWMRKQRPAMQPLDDTSLKAIDNLTYERYILEQRELEATERRHEIVDGLLTKLPESERTVMTLYYLGEMTTKEIGDFLSVSVNTIVSRLHRARKRLQETGEFLQMLNNNQQQNLATQITNHHRSGEFDRALEISARALESNPADLEAYGSRWRLIAEMFPEGEAKKRICPEIEYILQTHSETPEVLSTAYWGYMRLPNRTKNVPNSLFDKILQHPRTEIYLAALFGLVERSEETSQKWHYYQRVIDEFTVSDVPVLSWYLLAYEEMLRLVEQDRSLASEGFLDELIDSCLAAHLAYCKETQQYFGWAYTEAVKYRLKFNNRLDKAYEILERAEIRLAEAEERKWLVEHNKGSVEKASKKISRLRAEIYLRQEQWREAYDGLVANAPDYLESLWARFNESTINYFWMLGQSAEGMREWEKARRYYADAHFAPTPHCEKVRRDHDPIHFAPTPRVESRTGLERVYHQIRREGTTDTFEAFLKDTEAEYRIREGADCKRIRQKLITNRLNQKATDFQLETLEGEVYTLSAMAGKVVLLEVGTSSNIMLPEVKIVYERFSKINDVVVWSINDGETLHQVQQFLDEHQPPWPVLLDPHREVKKAYQIRVIPRFILIDKAGNWQYSCAGLDSINGQPLICMIEALLSDA